MKKFLCLITIGLLVMLLFLPPYLRRFANFDMEVVVANGQDDVISALNCKKNNEMINTSYLNNKPYNIQYKISGNYTLEDSEIDENEIIHNLRSYALVKYNEKKKQTVYKIEVDKINDKTLLGSYLLPINDASNYYQSLGFTCSAINL